MQLDYNFERDWNYGSVPLKPIECRMKFFNQKIVDDVNEHFHTNYLVREVYKVSNEVYLDTHEYICKRKCYIGVWS